MALVLFRLYETDNIVVYLPATAVTSSPTFSEATNLPSSSLVLFHPTQTALSGQCHAQLSPSVFRRLVYSLLGQLYYTHTSFTAPTLTIPLAAGTTLSTSQNFNIHQ